MQILVVDTHKQRRHQLISKLTEAGHNALQSCSPMDTLALLSQQHIDLIMMDSVIPGMGSDELIRLIRSRVERWLPIIFINDEHDDQQLSEAIHSGADDYLVRPISECLLTAKLQAFERISIIQRELDNNNRKLQALSCEDPLTGLLNRRGLEQGLENAWQEHLQQGSELSVLMIDIDHFKAYNDHYGHQQGDNCLQRVAELLQCPLEETQSLAARFGGEEFIVVLPHTPLESASLVAERIAQQLKQAKLPHHCSPTSTSITASIGISSTRMSAISIDELLEQADQAMYAAKNNGRDQQLAFNQIPQLINTASSRPLAVG